MAKKMINAFSAGEVSPYVYGRADNELYDKACLKMENFLPLEYGGATRRPALKFLTSGLGKKVLIPFISSTDETFLLEFTENNLAIYTNNGDLKESFETDFLEEELYQIRYVQLNKKLFFTHPNHNIYELTDFNSDFLFNPLDFKHPPLLEINDTDINIRTSAHTGSTTLTASSPFFDAGHVGSYMVFRSPRTFTNEAVPKSTSSVVKHFAYNSNTFVSGVTDSILASDSNFRVETTGIWDGKVILQRSFDNSTFEDYITIGDTTGSEDDSGDQKNFTFASTEEEPDNSYLRIKFIGGTDAHSHATGCTASIIIDNPYHYATVKIIEYTDSKNVNAEVIANFQYDIGDFDVNFDTTASEVTAGNRVFSKTSFDDIAFSGSNTTVDITDSSLVKLDASGSDLSSQWNTLTTVAALPNAGDRTYKESQIVDLCFGNNKIWILDKSAQVHTLSFNTTTAHEFDYNGIAFNVQSDFRALDDNLMTIKKENRGGTSDTGRLYNDNFESRKRVHSISYDPSNNSHPIAILGGKNTLWREGSSTSKYNRVRSYYYSYISSSTSAYYVRLDANAYAQMKVCFYNESGSKKSLTNQEDKLTGASTDHICISSKAWSKGDTINSWCVPRSVHYFANVVTIDYMDFNLRWLKREGDGRGLNVTNVYEFSSSSDTAPKLISQVGRNYKKGLFYGGDRTQESQRAYRDEYYKASPDFNTSVPTSNYTTGLKRNQLYNGYIYYDDDIKQQNKLNPSRVFFEYDNSSNVTSDTNLMGMFSTTTHVYGLRSDMVMFKYEDTETERYYYVNKTYTKGSDTTTTLENNGTLVEEFPVMTNWYEAAFSKYRGYPNDLAFYENRLVFAGTKQEPNTVHLSRIDDFNNFTLGTTATHALRLTINSGQQNPIKWIVGGRELFIGTDSNEWTLSSGSPSQALTPTQFGFKRRSQYGASNTNAVFVNSAVLFMMRQNKKLREWYLQDNQEDYLAQDLAFIAEHITGDGIKQIAVQTQPTTVVWMVRDDGELIGLTYERETKTVAWHRQKFDGLVESVAVLPSKNNEDEVFVAVKIENTPPSTNTTTSYSLGTPPVITFTHDNHGFSNGDSVVLRNFQVSSDFVEVTTHNNKLFTVSDVTTNTFRLKDISDTYVYTPAFNVKSIGLNSDNQQYLGTYTLVRGNGSISDTTSRWAFSTSTGSPTGEFSVDSGKWRFGVGSNFSMAVSSSPSTPSFPWDVTAWTNGTTGTSPFNNTAWADGSGREATTGNNVYVASLANDEGLTKRICAKLDNINWGTNYLTQYKGLDFYTEDNSNVNIDLDFSTVENNTYTANETNGDWTIRASNGGIVVIKDDQVRIKAVTDSSQTSQVSVVDALVEGDKYKLTYTVDATLGDPAMIGGTSPNNSHTTNSAETFINLKSTVGTHNVTFTAHTATGADGDPINFTIIKKGAGGSTDQILSNLKLERVRSKIGDLDHLNGKTVTAISNGTILSDSLVVRDAEVSITETSSDVYVGLPYTSTLAPLYHNIAYRNGTTLGNKTSIQRAVVRFKDTLSAKVGQTETNTDPVKFASTTALNNEDAEVWLENANEFLKTTFIIQDKPFPCTVLAMIVDVEGTA